MRKLDGDGVDAHHIRAPQTAADENVHAGKDEPGKSGQCLRAAEGNEGQGVAEPEAGQHQHGIDQVEEQGAQGDLAHVTPDQGPHPQPLPGQPESEQGGDGGGRQLGEGAALELHFPGEHGAGQGFQGGDHQHQGQHMENGDQAFVPVVFSGPGGQQGHSQGQDQVDQQQQAEDLLYLAAGKGGSLDECRAQSRAGENLEK